MKMEQAECSETSAYKIQTPGNHPQESIQQVSNIIKICPLGAELFRPDGEKRRTDKAKLITAFPNFTNVPKNLKPELCVTFFFSSDVT